MRRKYGRKKRLIQKSRCRRCGIRNCATRGEVCGGGWERPVVSKEEQTMIESNRMTAGSPAKHILKLAFPLMLGNIFQQLYTIVDTAVVGKAARTG